MENTPSWASRGFDRPVFGASSKNRLWLPKNTERNVVLLSDMPFCLWEHNLRQGKSYREYWTCIRTCDHRGCPLDELSKAYYIGFGTCIDTSKWTRRDGTAVENQRKLLPIRGQMMEYFENLRAAAGGRLRGNVYEVSRGTFDKSPAIGDRWKLIKQMTEQELTAKYGVENITELDYVSIMAPKDYDMVAQRALRLSPSTVATSPSKPATGMSSLVNTMNQPQPTPPPAGVPETDEDSIPF